MPHVHGDKIVWVDHRNDPSGSRDNPRNADIYWHDLATGKTQAVTTQAARQDWPDVWGDWVVWHDLRANPSGISGGNIDVYAKNLKTDKVYGIATTGASESYPRVDRDRVFYRSADPVNKLGAIFMVDLAAFISAKKTPSRPLLCATPSLQIGHLTRRCRYQAVAVNVRTQRPATRVGRVKRAFRDGHCQPTPSRPTAQPLDALPTP